MTWNDPLTLLSYTNILAGCICIYIFENYATITSRLCIFQARIAPDLQTNNWSYLFFRWPNKCATFLAHSIWDRLAHVYWLQICYDGDEGDVGDFVEDVFLQ